MRNRIKLVCLVAAGLSLATGTPAQTFTVLKTFNLEANATGFQPEGTLVQGPDNTLYGTTSEGGVNASGVVFKIQPDGTGFTVLKNFSLIDPHTGTNTDGANPYAGVVLCGNTLYGTTVGGGSSSNGTVFSVNTDGSSFSNLYNFSGGNDGANPYAGLMLSGGTLYGTTYGGGSSSNGTVFGINTNGGGFTNLYSFSGGDDGANPRAVLLLSGGMLYGTAENGGLWDWGTVFAVGTSGGGFTNLYSFGFDDGANPYAGLVLSGSALYGTTENGGSDGWGTVFTINSGGGGFNVLKSFTGGSDGGNPSAGLVLSGGMLYGTAVNGGGANPDSSAGGTVFGMPTDGSDFIVLSTGGYPYAGLLLSGNTLFGAKSYGDGNDGGTVFKVNTDRSDFTVLENFSAPIYEGSPYAGLVLSGNTLYGTTEKGTVFAVNTDGSGYTYLHEFGLPPGGINPYAGLTLSGGTLYGTTENGGGEGSGSVFAVGTNGGGGFTNLCSLNGNSAAGLVLSGSTLYGTTAGTVFAVNTNGGGLTNLCSLNGNTAAGLVLSGGTLYGTMESGTGTNYLGTVFGVNTNGGSYTNLYSFSISPEGSNGAYPYAGLVLSGSTLYGTTEEGGSSVAGSGTVFTVNTNGGSFTNLHIFSGSDGAKPYAGLVLSGSTLYGTTLAGGSYGDGTVFKVNTNGGGFSVLYSFTGGNDGAKPYAGLVLSGSTLYGTAAYGGSYGEGTVFALNLSVPLNIAMQDGQVVLSWSNPTFSLQAAPSVTGVYTNVTGATSPYTISTAGAVRFFRLQGN